MSGELVFLTHPDPDHVKGLNFIASHFSIGQFWERKRTEAELATKRVVALIPVGSTEAHGPHLPLATDVLISRGMAFAAAELALQRSQYQRILASGGFDALTRHRQCPLRV